MQPDTPLQPDGSVSCPDHPCDGCYLCRRRRCCRQDRPDFPRFGDWTQPIYGELGVLTVDEDDKLICHVCGKPYHSLDHHARLAHDLWPEEYQLVSSSGASDGFERNG
jgi:hypothetical protein